jgi:hypothetical protein
MDGNDLAHPVKHSYGEEFFTIGGLTKREKIAAMAMQGMLANPTFGCPKNVAAQHATQYADALIERLNADPAEGASNGK